MGMQDIGKGRTNKPYKQQQQTGNNNKQQQQNYSAENVGLPWNYSYYTACVVDHPTKPGCDVTPLFIATMQYLKENNV